MKTLRTTYGYTALPSNALAVEAWRCQGAGHLPALLPQYAIPLAALRVLADFELGDEIFVRSENLEEVIDRTNSDAERQTRIWWRAIIVADGARAHEFLAAEVGAP